ncbi:MAG: glycoside hydrolase family 127 protein [Prevotellaceae bacterium]|nr:glycoside hydrolase family 127 protein [Prevotellaceae bacterium]
MTAALAGCRNETRFDIVERPCTSAVNTNYTGHRNPLLPAAFIKLPVGSIRPGGWVEEYLLRQRDGLTGHLGQISAWLDKTNNAWLHPQGIGDHGWEEVPYWLKGYGNIGYILNDTAMRHETARWIEAVLNSQRSNGFFGPYIERHGKPDLWGNMIMLWCLQSWYEYSADERVIPLMTAYFRWQHQLPDSLFLEDYWEHSRGGDNLYSIYWLYNITGDAFLLELASKTHGNTADWTQRDRLPNWHNVNIAQAFREPATYYLQSHDTAHLQATYRAFHLIRRLYGQAPGGMFGADENARPGYHDPRQGVETCGMVEQMSSDEMLLRITGDPFWADHCENIAFNSYPAAVMPDFKALRYITAPNMILSDDRNHHPGIDNGGPFLLMNPFSSRCCQHNHAQGWPYYAENLWLASPDNGLAATLYAESTVRALVANGQPVVLEQQTHYPFDETVRIIVREGHARFPLYLRIPQWCREATVRVAGAGATTATASATAPPASYLRIERTWTTGDTLVLSLPMHLYTQTYAQNGNSVSLHYGPLAFSLLIEEQYIEKNSAATTQWDSRWQATADPAQWPSYEIRPASAWNYGLLFDPAQVEASFEVVKQLSPADRFPFTPATVPWTIKAKGVRIPEWGIDEHGLCAFVPQSPVSSAAPVEEITLVPMGAARLRIAAFPVIGH